MFIGRRRIWFVLSAALVLVSLGSLAVRGLNLGIDFTGGVLMELAFSREVSTGEVRSVLVDHGLGQSQIVVDQRREGHVLIRAREIDETTRRQVIDDLGQRVAPVRSDDIHLVSPVVAAELIRLALLALGIAIFGMIVYITLRFEFKFAMAAIAALLHDSIITLGFFSLAQLDLSSPFIAALLTIMGYSINDTIVVFDRIRENLKQIKKQSLADLVEASIHQTLRRSLYTSATTLAAVIAIYALGGRTTQGFALALIVGIVSGTYSSIFLASPLWMSWKALEPAMRRHVSPRS